MTESSPARRRRPALAANLTIAGVSVGATLGGAGWLGAAAAPSSQDARAGSHAATGVSGPVEVIIRREIIVRHHPVDEAPWLDAPARSTQPPPAVASIPARRPAARPAPAQRSRGS